MKEMMTKKINVTKAEKCTGEHQRHLPVSHSSVQGLEFVAVDMNAIINFYTSITSFFLTLLLGRQEGYPACKSPTEAFPESSLLWILIDVE